jgi:hypothetical protein
MGQPHAVWRRSAQSLQPNPKTVSEIIRSEAAIKAAAGASGLASRC